MSHNNTPANAIFLARQPIFDNNLNLFAYELLFRGNEINQSGVDALNGDIATSKVINHTFLEFGIERVLGGKLGFINLTRAFLTGEIPLPFDNNHVVLEVLEDIVIDEEIIEAVKNFSKQGYTIALDDFIYNEDLKPLVDVADIIKIDLLALTDEELAEHVQILKQFDVKLLAEKVESQEQLQRCKMLGFDFYQGYFFCKPTIIDDQPLANNKIATLRVLTELQRSDASIDDIENIIKLDLSLSFKLLRCLNSAAVASPKKVESLKQAVIYLGLKAIKSWVTIITFSNTNSRMSPELLVTALVRAKMAESLASVFKCNSETAFLLGLFSIADAMFNKPMSGLLEELPVSKPIKLALKEGEGELGKLLMFIRTHERGSLTVMPSSLNIPDINKAYIAATEWANHTLRVVN